MTLIGRRRSRHAPQLVGIVEQDSRSHAAENFDGAGQPAHTCTNDQEGWQLRGEPERPSLSSLERRSRAGQPESSPSSAQPLSPRQAPRGLTALIYVLARPVTGRSYRRARRQGAPRSAHSKPKL